MTMTIKRKENGGLIHRIRTNDFHVLLDKYSRSLLLALVLVVVLVAVRGKSRTHGRKEKS